MSREDKFFTILLLIIIFLCGLLIGLDAKKEKSCTKVNAFIPVNGKWIEREVCLESN